MKNLGTILAIVAIILSGYALTKSESGGPQKVSEKHSLQQEILDRGVIKAAYIPYPPSLIKDTETGEISGIIAETFEQASENLGLEVEWVEEVAWGSMIEGLKTGRYDVVASGIWATASRAREADFSIPLYYSAVSAYAGADENRFAENNFRDLLNNEGVTLATLDGEMSAIIAAENFPVAKTVALPQTASISELLSLIHI